MTHFVSFYWLGRGEHGNGNTFFKINGKLNQKTIEWMHAEIKKNGGGAYGEVVIMNIIKLDE